MVNSVGSTPLSTHDSWNRVSNLAKALPWLASGALRWTIDAKAIRATADAMFTAIDKPTAAPTPPASEASTPATVTRASEAMIITRSLSALRSNGANPLPTITPTVTEATARPSH